MQLRWYQNEANAAVMAYLYQRAGRGVPCNPLVVLPTGTGKTLVINNFIWNVLQQWPTQKIVVATHVKELIEQSSNEMLDYWPFAPVGVCSAGMDRYETDMPITYGGIKTLMNRVDLLGFVHILMVDECHLISDDGTTTYLKFIELLRKVNPNLVVIGYTATDFRLGMGKLTEGGLFTEVVYDMSTPEAFTRLFVDGHLVPPVAKDTTNYINAEGVSINHNGDYNLKQLQGVFKQNKDLLFNCLREACTLGYDRRSWLVFNAGVEDAQDAAKILRGFGVSAEAIYDGLGKKQRNEYIQAFKNFELRALTNNNILTTGFNHRALDFIVCLRKTVSASLWIQMLGRGMRPYPEGDKRNCRVADFARNTETLGTIDEPRIPNKKGKGGGDMPIWLCPACGTKNHARAPFCIDCGAAHIFEAKLTEAASDTPLVSTDAPVIELFGVDQVIYMPSIGNKTKDGTELPPSLRITYHCQSRRFTEFVTPAGRSWEVHKFHQWWKQRHMADPPATLYDCQFFISQLRKPKQIRVHVNAGKYPRVMGALF